MKTILKYMLMFAAMAAITATTACSDDDSTEPTPPDGQGESVKFSEKDYQEKLAGSLWVYVSATWMDEEGNDYGFDAYDLPIGGITLSRFLYTGTDCVVEFLTIDDSFSMMFKGTIDPESGLLGQNYTSNPMINIYFDSVDGDILRVRTRYGQYSPKKGEPRDDIYLMMEYKRLPAEFTHDLFSMYTPNNFKPEVLNLPPAPDKPTTALFEALTEGLVWRSRGAGEWKDAEGNVLATGTKLNVRRMNWLYIGKGFYLYPDPKGKGSLMVKGTYDEATGTFATTPDDKTQDAIFVHKLSPINLEMSSGKGLYKENGNVRDDVTYHYTYFVFASMTLKDYIEMFPPENYTPADVGLE